MNVFCPGCGARFSVASSPIDPEPSATCPKCKSTFPTGGVTETGVRVQPRRKFKPKKASGSGRGTAITVAVLLLLGAVAGGLWYAGILAPATAPKRGVPSTEPGWREITSAEGRFKVMLPGAPQRRVRSKKEMEYSLETPDSRIGVVFADLGDKDKPEKYMVAPPRAKIRSESDVTVGDYKGRDITCEVGADVVHMRFVIAGKRLYTVLIAGKNGKQPSEADIARVIDSFRVTG